MTLAPGSRLGVYEIISPLGAGGMGEVYRARDTRLNRGVAIKVLPEAFAHSAERAARFEREAQALAALNHPGIAQIYGVIEDSPAAGASRVHALVMELVEGEDLRERLARGPIPVDESLAIARQLSEALGAAHDAGIIHRDLKPANIKLCADGTVKVLDFGLAKALAASIEGGGHTDPTSTPDPADSPTVTVYGSMPGELLGTAAYMSPEQARGRRADKRADTWAFGLVLYEMLAGRPAFGGDSVSETLASVLRDTPDLDALPPGTPGSVRRLIARCLERDPRKRPRDVGDAWAWIDAEPEAAAAAPRRGRWAAIPWTVAAGAVALGAAAFWIAAGRTALAPTAPPIAFSEPPPQGTQFVDAPVPSPDGRSLAMVVQDAAGQTRLWTREIGEPAARAIDGTEGAAFAFWSPDSSQVAFAGGGQLRRVARDGGAVSLVATADLKSGVWLPDGDIMIAVVGRGLMRVPGTGGTARPAAGFDRESLRTVEISSLDVSPDGRYLLFDQFGGETGVYVARLDGSNMRLLYPGQQSGARFVSPDLIVREADGVLVAQRFRASDMTLVGEVVPVARGVRGLGRRDFWGGPAGALSYVAGGRELSQLVWFDRAGRMAGLAGPNGEYGEVAISRGGRWLAFVRTDPSDGNIDVWLQSMSSAAPVRFTTDPDVDHLLSFSPDEREVAWEAHAGGALNLMRRPADGSAPARLIRPWGRAGGTCDWSPDGRFVLYESYDGPAGMNLWAVPLDGSGEPVRLTQPGFGAEDGRFSPDGRWLAYTARATGEREIYLQRIEGTKLLGGPMRVSGSGGQWPHWRRDSAELFYLDRETLMAVDVRSAGDRPAGSPRPLFAIKGLAGEVGAPFAVTPDGQKFLAIVAVAGAPPRHATVVLNWGAAQKR